MSALFHYRTWLRLCGLFLISLYACAAAPQRIVSLNACTDQLLIEVADRDRIVGVSNWARDTSMSAYSEEARSLYTVRGSAEEVIGLKPDLVIVGSFSTRETVSILNRLGYEVMEFTPANSFEDIIGNLRKMGAAIGEADRTEEIIARMEERLTAVTPQTGDRPLFANYEANGWSTGAGTLTADIATRAGYRTLGDELGYQGARQVNLETFLTIRPDVIDLGDTRDDAPALASEALKHPALHHVLRGAKEVDIPGNLTICGTPKTVKAVEILAEARP